MLDEKFFVAVAFFVFVALVLKPAKRLILAALDARILKVKAELDEAARLKDEAYALLHRLQREQEKSLEEVQAIMEHARKEAERMTNDAKEVLEFAMAKRTEVAMQKIAQAEASVLTDLRSSALDITLDAARSLILENMSPDMAEEILTQAFRDVERKMH